MKNLPDKIYLNFGDITKEEFEESDYKEFCKIDEFAVTYCEDKVFDCDVEFVRKDALIEKAVSYLNSELYDWVQTTNPNQRSYANTIMKQDFIKDFRNYMKKE